MHGNDSLEIEGLIMESLSNQTFRVAFDNGHRILAHLSGEMRLSFIRLLPGDKVLVECSPFDLNRGRIIAKR